jgi:hypothetical protein
MGKEYGDEGSDRSDVGWETSPILPKGHSLTGPEGLDFSEDFNWILF